MSENRTEQVRPSGAHRSSVRVLYVDDDSKLAELVASFLDRERQAMETTTASSASEGLEKLEDRAFDCVVSDYQMPRQDGLTFYRNVEDLRPEIPFLLYTGRGSEEIASRAISLGIDEYLQKQHDTDHYTVLANRITNLVEKYRSEREVDRILNRMTDSFFALDTDWRFTYLNDSAVNLLNRSRSALIGTRIWDEFPKTVDLSYYDQYHTAMDTQETVTFVEQCPVTDEPLRERVYPSPTGLSIYFREAPEEAGAL